MSVISRICVDLAVNNDAGNFSGELAAVSISAGSPLENIVQFDGDTLTAELFPGPHVIKVAGCELRYYRSIEWHGNMAWNGYEMTIADAARLLETLRRNHWTCIEADARLMDTYDRGESMEAVLMDVLQEVIG